MNACDGTAIVYCDGAFGTTNGKTAHGLVRHTKRYHVCAVVDAQHAGRDAGFVLDGTDNGIPILATIEAAAQRDTPHGRPTHLVVGLAPDGGRLSEVNRRHILDAIRIGLNVDCGLHDFLTEDPEIVALAAAQGVTLRDIRKPKPRHQLHFFTGKIEQVKALKIAVLGTDSAVGKRTTAWLIVHGLNALGVSAELIGTGQTAWLQGARYGTVMDALVNDFVSGEIEHAVWSCWHEQRPDVLVLEGQGSLLNPAYPGGFEILAAGRPDCIILQHAPARKEYDGFPGYPIHPISRQIKAVEVISGKPVIALTLNHESMTRSEVADQCIRMHQRLGLPTFDPLWFGSEDLFQLLSAKLHEHQGLVRKSA